MAVGMVANGSDRWCDRLREAADGCHDAYVYFNNDIGGHAPRDAAVLPELLCQ